jgi:serine/threonine-protein kinase
MAAKLSPSTFLVAIVAASVLTACSGRDPIGALVHAKAPDAAHHRLGRSPTDLAVAPGSASGVADATVEGADVAARVRALLEQRCAGCHGAAGAAPGGLADVANLEALARHAAIVPGDPDRSLLVQAVESGKMPPSGGALAQSERDDLKAWIRSLATPDDDPAKRTPIEREAVYQAAARDLLTHELAERVNFRYVDASALYNARLPSAYLRTLRRAADKVVNAASNRPELVALAEVEGQPTLLRLDLRDYGWTAEAWDRLVEAYPYAAADDGVSFAGILREDTKATTPLVRADWLATNASKGGAYYRLLGAPGSLAKLATWLGTDLDGQLARDEVVRAGYRDSAVSDQNRVIERHAIRDGFLWRSYEFANSVGTLDVLANPLGPTSSDGKDAPDGGRDPIDLARGLGAAHAFTTDGGEFIFTLPNGMLAFYVVGQDGNRLNEAPASQKVGAGKRLFAGISCMNCHKAGLIMRKDEVRAAAAGAGLSDDELARVQRLYPAAEAFQAQIDADTAAYRARLTAFGVNPDDADPVHQVELDLGAGLTRARLAAELWTTESELDAALLRALAKSGKDAQVLNAISILRSQVGATAPAGVGGGEDVEVSFLPGGVGPVLVQRTPASGVTTSQQPQVRAALETAYDALFVELHEPH